MTVLAKVRSIALALATVSLFGFSPACSTVRISHTDAQSVHTEPKSGGRYYLVRPSNYNRKSAWPLIVLCHSRGGDSPQKQLSEWADLAEQRGFVVAAPQFDHAHRSRWTDEALVQSEQIAAANLVLNTVEHVRAGHNISEDRILIYGYGQGAEPALRAGLSRPDVFRAISLNKPIVGNDRLPGNWTQVDPYQPIHLRYNNNDRLFYKRYNSLREWLHLIGAHVQHDWAGAVDRERAARSVAFFELLLRKEPWLHVLAHKADAGRPFTVQLILKSSFEPTQIRWDLGDGNSSYETRPTHTFANAGTYPITVYATGDGRKELSRRVWLTMPDGLVTPRKPL